MGLTHFISSGSSLSSLAGVTLAPAFLARGQPDKLVQKEDKSSSGPGSSSHVGACSLGTPQKLHWRALCWAAARPGASPESPMLPAEFRDHQQFGGRTSGRGCWPRQCPAQSFQPHLRAEPPTPPATPLGVAGSPPMRCVVPRDVAGAVAARCGAPVEDSRAGAEPWSGPQRGTLCTQARGTRLPPGVSQTAEPIPARTPPPGPAGPPVSPGGQTARLQGRWHSVPPAGFRLDQKVPEQTRPLTLSSSAWKGKLET